jgi:hypothetical protein
MGEKGRRAPHALFPPVSIGEGTYKGGPADGTGVIDAMDAITIAAERLYAEARTPDTEGGEPDGADRDEDIHDDRGRGLLARARG